MMMQGMRKAGQSFLGKLVITVMFGFLIFSFAIWGIGDIFQGYGRNVVARVGKTEIGLEQMRNTYQNDVQQLTRQQRAAQFTQDSLVHKVGDFMHELCSDLRYARIFMNNMSDDTVTASN